MRILDSAGIWNSKIFGKFQKFLSNDYITFFQISSYNHLPIWDVHNWYQNYNMFVVDGEDAFKGEERSY